MRPDLYDQVEVVADATPTASLGEAASYEPESLTFRVRFMAGW